MRVPEDYGRVPDWARRELADRAADERPELETFEALVMGETADEAWNACQKQFLLDGWMHNNPRMYWSKRLIAMTPSAEAGWATACYLNDRSSLDGRDPSTYGNIARAFGDGAPGHGRKPIYGLVPGRSACAIRKRAVDRSASHQAGREALAISVPVEPPVDPSLTGQLSTWPRPEKGGSRRNPGCSLLVDTISVGGTPFVTLTSSLVMLRSALRDPA